MVSIEILLVSRLFNQCVDKKSVVNMSSSPAVQYGRSVKEVHGRVV